MLKRSEEINAIERDFRLNYHSVLLPHLKKMEFIRVILYFIFLICALALVSASVMLCWAFFNSASTEPWEYLLAIIPLIFIFSAHRFWELILNIILKKKLLNYILVPFKTFKADKIFDIPSIQLKESKIIEKYVFKINPERIDGVYRGVNIRFNSALLFDIVSTFSNGKRRMKIKNVFSGYIVEMDMNKTFSGHTILESHLIHTDESFLDRFKENYYEMEEVELEDPDFKKHFTTIKTTDQVEARYLLNPTMMEKLKDMESAFSRMFKLTDFRLSFLDKKVMIAMKVYSANNMLKLCSLNKPLYKQDKEICAFKDTLLETIEIVDELDLDEKIGTY